MEGRRRFKDASPVTLVKKLPCTFEQPLELGVKLASLGSCWGPKKASSRLTFQQCHEFSVPLSGGFYIIRPKSSRFLLGWK